MCAGAAAEAKGPERCGVCGGNRPTGQPFTLHCEWTLIIFVLPISSALFKTSVTTYGELTLIGLLSFSGVPLLRGSHR